MKTLIGAAVIGAAVLMVATPVLAGGADQCVQMRGDIGTAVIVVPHVGQVQIRPLTLGITTGFNTVSLVFQVRWQRAVLLKGVGAGGLVFDVPDPVRPYQHIADSDVCPVFDE